MHARQRCASFAVAAMLLTGCAADDVTQPPRDVSLAGAAPPSAFRMVELPLPKFSTSGAALAVNNLGAIVGWTDSVGGPDGGRAPTLWMPGKPPMRLLVGQYYMFGGAAMAINDNYDIVGFMGGFGNPYAEGLVWGTGQTLKSRIHAFTPRSINNAMVLAGNACAGPCAAGLSTFAGSISALPCPGAPSFPGSCYTGSAASINDKGDAVGRFAQYPSGAPKRAILWHAGGGTMDLGAVYGSGTDAEATHINSQRSVSGAQMVNGVMSPIVWYLATGAVRVFGSGSGGSGIATSISDNNRVVGTETVAGYTRAFTATSVADYGFLPGRRGRYDSFANDVNNCGTIVGSANKADGTSVPVMWQVDGGGTCDKFELPPVNWRVGTAGSPETAP